jgi:hypothetical protein
MYRRANRSYAREAMSDQPMNAIVDIDRYPLEDTTKHADLLSRCRAEWAANGSFSLEGFLRPDALKQCVAEIDPVMIERSYHHAARHNIYFSNADDIPEAINAPSLAQRSSNHTLTADQLDGMIIRRVHHWPPLARFLESVLDKPALFAMADPMAGVNVMSYREGDQIGWHFDRAEFTVTLLLRRPDHGGMFQFRRNLRGPRDPNHGGVVTLLSGKDPDVTDLPIEAGTLNVFAGYRSPHRVTPTRGSTPRMVAVLSYMEAPNVVFSAEDRLRFYGRTDPSDPVPGTAADRTDTSTSVVNPPSRP